jgi:EAL domain-containing protein (putative c-di-GMP-specific phosphodiesterase class I)
MQTVKGLACALSRAFGISVVAEAVETALQDSPLIELGCAWGQGFHDGAVRCGPISHAGRTGLEGCPPVEG